jgi:Helix-turn-helix domain
MPFDELTLTVPEAGRRYFGLSVQGAYAAAQKGQMPVIRIGRRLRVPVRALEAMLDRAATTTLSERAA